MKDFKVSKQQFLKDSKSFKYMGLTPKKENIDKLASYIYNKKPTNGFLNSILENDLFGAVCKVGTENPQNIMLYIIILYKFAPSDCWGDKTKVRQWIYEKEPALAS